MKLLNKGEMKTHDSTLVASRQNNRKFKKSSIKRNKIIFLTTLLIFPIAQFLIFYFGVNINSVLLAFKKYDSGIGDFVWSGFSNFARVINEIFVTGELVPAILNSLIQFSIALVTIPLHISVAYCIFKKVPFSGFYKIIVFLPSILSSMVYVLCFKYLFTKWVPTFIPSASGILVSGNDPRDFLAVLLFGVWMGFAGGLVIYLSSMSSISIDVIEYGKLEKMNSLQELWHIVVPQIYPTIITYVVVTFAGFFTNYGYFFSFFGEGNKLGNDYDTLGFIFFVKIVGNGSPDSALMSNYPYASAAGLIFTLICAPLTIGVKTIMEKFGPKEE